jgi:hypothetical protein
MDMVDLLAGSMKKAKITSEYYFLFSAKSFSSQVQELAERDKRYILVDMNEL